MREFLDKNDALRGVRRDISEEFYGLHPVDRVDAYRTLEKEAGKAAVVQEEINDREGVPERPQDGGR